MLTGHFAYIRQQVQIANNYLEKHGRSPASEAMSRVLDALETLESQLHELACERDDLKMQTLTASNGGPL
jgi:hypothetical protein